MYRKIVRNDLPYENEIREGNSPCRLLTTPEVIGHAGFVTALPVTEKLDDVRAGRINAMASSAS